MNSNNIGFTKHKLASIELMYQSPNQQNSTTMVGGMSSEPQLQLPAAYSVSVANVYILLTDCCIAVALLKNVAGDLVVQTISVIACQSGRILPH